MSKIGTDLSQGSVASMLVRFSFPFILSGIVQNLYGMVDVLVISHFASAASLAGVNSAYSYISVVTNFIIGFCNGGTVIIGQYAGMKDRSRLQEAIGTLCALIAILAVLLTALSIPLCDGILNLFQTPAEAMAEARSYLIISAVGLIFIFAYNMLSAVLRGVGESKMPFRFICIACVVNIVLDLILVAGFRMGAAGAAIATIAAQGLSAILCLIYLNHADFIFTFRLKAMRIKKDMLLLLLKVGTPSALQNGLSVAAYSVLTAVANILGVTTAAALACSQKITLFAILPSMALGNALSAMCAQNFGSGSSERAVRTMYVGAVLNLGINFILFAIVELAAYPLMGIFTADSGILDAGVVYLRWCAFDFLFVPFQGAFIGYVVGSGHTTLPAVISMCSSLFIRSGVALLLGLTTSLGITGVGLASPIASLTASIFCIIYFYAADCKHIVPVVKNSDTVSNPSGNRF